MKLLDKKTAADTTRLAIFIIVTTIATSLLVITIGNITFSKSNEYKALFTDATGVVTGDDVRIAGVRVGSVKSVSIVSGQQACASGDSTTGISPQATDSSTTECTAAEVDFSVDQADELFQSTNATIRYRNLVGQRYVSLSPGIGGTQQLASGSTIPLSQTHPALDLTVLFNGFKPLFQALSPDDINKLSYEIVQVFQGEGGTVEDLLSTTASVTNTLANRDQVIGQLIDNLNYVLDHLADRNQQLSSLIKSFKRLVDGLKNDRQAILGSLGSISDLTDQTASLVRGVRPPFVADIKQLRRFATITDRNKAELDRTLQVLPIKLNKVSRTAAYGSFFNFYLCHFQGRITLPKLPVIGQISRKVNYNVGAQRCHLG